MPQHLYLVIVKKEVVPIDYFLFPTRSLIEASVKHSWHKIPEQAPEVIWDSHNGTAGPDIDIKLVAVYDHVDHL